MKLCQLRVNILHLTTHSLHYAIRREGNMTSLTGYFMRYKCKRMGYFFYYNPFSFSLIWAFHTESCEARQEYVFGQCITTTQVIAICQAHDNCLLYWHIVTASDSIKWLQPCMYTIHIPVDNSIITKIYILFWNNNVLGVRHEPSHFFPLWNEMAEVTEIEWEYGMEGSTCPRGEKAPC